MPRTGFKLPETPRTGSLELQCPECTETVKVAARDLVEGAEVECPHCGCAGEVTREYDIGTSRSRWVLVDPAADFDDDLAR